MKKTLTPILCGLSLLSLSALAQEAADSASTQAPSFDPVAQMISETQRALQGLASTDNLHLCNASVRSGNRYRNLGSVTARESTSNGCSAEQAQAISAALPPQTCTFISIQSLDTANASADIDLSLDTDYYHDDDNSTDIRGFARVILCNDRAMNTSPAELYIQAVNYGNSTEPANTIISRVDFPLSAMQARAEQVRAEQEAQAAREADSSGTEVQFTDELRNQAVTNLSTLLSGWSSNTRLSGYDLRGLQVANVPMCNIDMGSPNQNGHRISATARAGSSNACSAEQAQAINASVAANTCALIAVKGLYNAAPRTSINDDIDMSAQITGLDNNPNASSIDQNLDNNPVVVVCNNSSEAKPLVLNGLSTNIRHAQAVIARYNFSAGANGDGSMPAEVLSAAKLEAMKTYLARQVSDYRAAGARRLTYNAASQPVCSAQFNGTDQRGIEFLEDQYSTVAISARTGDNACTAAQAQAITAPVGPGKCIIILAYGVRNNVDIDMKLTPSREISEAARLEDVERDAFPLVSYCNTSRTADTITLTGRGYNQSSASPALITRLEYNLR